jgi:glutathionylspermidine synthase
MRYYIENSAQKQSEEEIEEESQEEVKKLVKHSVTVVSNDVKHDAFAAYVSWKCSFLQILSCSSLFLQYL